MLNAVEVSRLLDELCTRNGFCLPLIEQQRLEKDPPEDVNSFANAVLVAEDLNPELVSRPTRRAIQATISAAFERAAGPPNKPLKNDARKNARAS